MLAGTPSRAARRRPIAIVVALIALLAVGAATSAVAAQASTGSNDALKRARQKYNAAQKKCVKQHQLSQLRRILKFAKEIKKNGGGKIKKKQLYKCLGFGVSFTSHLTVKASYHQNGMSVTDDWTYDLLPFSGGTLKPDYKDATSQEVDSSGTLEPLYHFKGSASATHDQGEYSTDTTQKAGKTFGARGYSAMVSINPSAKHPRDTIELWITANPPLERYPTQYHGGGSATETGQVWLYMYDLLHRKQKPAGLPPSLACSQTVFKGIARGLPDGTVWIAQPTYDSSRSFRLSGAGSSCGSANGTKSIPDTAYVSSDPWTVPELHVADSTTIGLTHEP